MGKTFEEEKEMRSICQEIEQELKAFSTAEKREVLPRFFKTGPGQYGEGDRFLGVAVPDVRLVARRHQGMTLDDVESLLQSPWHECRLCALLLLVLRFRKAGEEEQKALFGFYLSHTACINNWDLVDLSAPAIVGEYLREHSREVLYQLADSRSLWERRIAVVSTLTLIRHDEFAELLRLTEHFLCLHRQEGKLHDLMQKALGWMLREMGKRNLPLLRGVLECHAATMPRTMLRYAIEKLAAEERTFWMKASSAG